MVTGALTTDELAAMKALRDTGMSNVLGEWETARDRIYRMVEASDD